MVTETEHVVFKITRGDGAQKAHETTEPSSIGQGFQDRWLEDCRLSGAEMHRVKNVKDPDEDLCIVCTQRDSKGNGHLYQLFSMEGEELGVVTVEFRDNHLRAIALDILPAHMHNGYAETIATWLVEQAMERYAANRYPFELHLVNNLTVIRIAQRIFEGSTIQIYNVLEGKWVDLTDPSFDFFEASGPYTLLSDDYRTGYGQLVLRKNGESDFDVISAPKGVNIEKDGLTLKVTDASTGKLLMVKNMTSFALRGGISQTHETTEPSSIGQERSEFIADPRTSPFFATWDYIQIAIDHYRSVLSASGERRKEIKPEARKLLEPLKAALNTLIRSVLSAIRGRRKEIKPEARKLLVSLEAALNTLITRERGKPNLDNVEETLRFISSRGSQLLEFLQDTGVTGNIESEARMGLEAANDALLSFRRWRVHTQNYEEGLKRPYNKRNPRPVRRKRPSRSGDNRLRTLMSAIPDDANGRFAKVKIHTFLEELSQTEAAKKGKVTFIVDSESPLSYHFKWLRPEVRAQVDNDRMREELAEIRDVSITFGGVAIGPNDRRIRIMGYDVGNPVLRFRLALQGLDDYDPVVYMDVAELNAPLTKKERDELIEVIQNHQNVSHGKAIITEIQDVRYADDLHSMQDAELIETYPIPSTATPAVGVATETTEPSSIGSKATAKKRGRPAIIPDLLSQFGKDKLNGLNIPQAARLIGVTESGLRYHLEKHPGDYKKYGIKRPANIPALLKAFGKKRLKNLNMSQVARLIGVTESGLWDHFQKHPGDFKKYGIKKPVHIPALLQFFGKERLNGLNIPEAARLIGATARGLLQHLGKHPRDFKKYGIKRPRKQKKRVDIPALLKAFGKKRLKGLNITQAAKLIGATKAGLSLHLINYPKDLKKYGIVKGGSASETTEPSSIGQRTADDQERWERFVDERSAEELVEHLKTTRRYEEEGDIRETLLLRDPAKLDDFEERLIQERSLPLLPSFENFRPIYSAETEEELAIERKVDRILRFREDLATFRPIIIELIRQYGKIGNMRGKRGIELGPARNLALLEYLRKRRVKIDAIGGDFTYPQEETRYLHKVGDYNDFFNSDCPEGSLDFIYARRALYFATIEGYAPVANPDDFTRDELMAMRYIPLNRVLKTGGFIISVYDRGEEGDLLSEAEMERLGFENVKRYYVQPSEESALIIVSVMRKKGPPLITAPAEATRETTEPSSVGQQPLRWHFDEISGPNFRRARAFKAELEQRFEGAEFVSISAGAESSCFEIGMNIMVHGKGGDVEVSYAEDEDGLRKLEAIGIDEGPGIKGNLNDLLQQAIENHKAYRAGQRHAIGVGLRNIVLFPDKVVIETNGEKWVKRGEVLRFPLRRAEAERIESELVLVHVGPSEEVKKGTRVTVTWEWREAPDLSFAGDRRHYADNETTSGSHISDETTEPPSIGQGDDAEREISEELNEKIRRIQECMRRIDFTEPLFLAGSTLIDREGADLDLFVSERIHSIQMRKPGGPLSQLEDSIVSALGNLPRPIIIHYMGRNMLLGDEFEKTFRYGFIIAIYPDSYIVVEDHIGPDEFIRRFIERPQAEGPETTEPSSIGQKTESEEVTLSTGMVVTKSQPNREMTYPLLDIIPELHQMAREPGFSHSLFKEIVARVKGRIEEGLGKETLPIDLIFLSSEEFTHRYGENRRNSTMSASINLKKKRIELCINEEHCKDLSEEVWILSIAHEIFGLLLVPPKLIDSLYREMMSDEDVIEPLVYSKIVHLGEGLANFETGLPYGARYIKGYADAIEMGESSVPIRNPINGQISHLLEAHDWHTDPHPLGSLLFDTFSRINPEQMWEYAFSFIEETLEGDYSVERIGQVDFARVMYEDYVKLSRLLGEEPYPSYVFFEEATETTEPSSIGQEETGGVVLNIGEPKEVDQHFQTEFTLLEEAKASLFSQLTDAFRTGVFRGLTNFRISDKGNHILFAIDFERGILEVTSNLFDNIDLPLLLQGSPIQHPIQPNTLIPYDDINVRDGEGRNIPILTYINRLIAETPSILWNEASGEGTLRSLFDFIETQGVIKKTGEEPAISELAMPSRLIINVEYVEMNGRTYMRIVPIALKERQVEDDGTIEWHIHCTAGHNAISYFDIHAWPETNPTQIVVTELEEDTAYQIGLFRPKSETSVAEARGAYTLAESIFGETATRDPSIPKTHFHERYLELRKSSSETTEPSSIGREEGEVSHTKIKTLEELGQITDTRIIGGILSGVEEMIDDPDLAVSGHAKRIAEILRIRLAKGRNRLTQPQAEAIFTHDAGMLLEIRKMFLSLQEGEMLKLLEGNEYTLTVDSAWIGKYPDQYRIVTEWWKALSTIFSGSNTKFKEEIIQNRSGKNGLIKITSKRIAERTNGKEQSSSLHIEGTHDIGPRIFKLLNMAFVASNIPNITEDEGIADYDSLIDFINAQYLALTGIPNYIDKSSYNQATIDRKIRIIKIYLQPIKRIDYKKDLEVDMAVEALKAV